MKFEHLQYPIKTLPNGDSLNLNAFRLTGTASGPHIHIQSSVHGAEVQGNAVILELMDYLSKNEFRGSITFIPTANPMAINNKSGTFTQGRFNPQSGNNWNRNYQNLEDHTEIFQPKSWIESLKLLDEDKNSIKKKYKEYLKECLNKIKEKHSTTGLSEDVKLNITLQLLASGADIVLDLHTGPKAARYLYSSEYCEDKVKDLPFPFTIIIPNEFAGAMDEATFMPWVHLSRILKSMDLENLDPNQFESYTLELGSEELIDSSLSLRDTERILSFLSQRGILRGKFHPTSSFEPQRAGKLSDYKTYYAPRGGLYEFSLRPGELGHKGQTLCKYINFSPLKESETLQEALPRCSGEIKILEDAYVINHNPSAVISEGQTLYQVLEKTWLLS